jgi:hypothetical protein
MKVPWWIALACAVGGLLAGWGLASRDAGNEVAGGVDSTAGRAGPAKSGMRPEPRVRSRVGELRQEIRGASPDKIPQLLYRALEVGDPIDRQLLVGEALLGMDETNWEEIMATFGRITRETGRTHGTEWTNALLMVGRRAGPEGMGLWQKLGMGGYSKQTWNCMYGWGAENPAEAMAWLEGMGPDLDEHRRRLIPAVVSGAALVDGELGMRMLAALPPDERAACLGPFISNLVQNGGNQAVVDWAIGTANQTAGDDPGFAAQAVSLAVQRLCDAAVTAKGGTKQAAALLTRLGEGTELPPELLGGALSRFHGADPLNLVRDLGTAVGMDDAALRSQLTRRAVMQVAMRNPDDLLGWMNDNRELPRGEEFLAAADEVLRQQGRADLADRLGEADP